MLQHGVLDASNLFTWNWMRGAATPKADFGDPLTTTSYAVCVYDRHAGAPILTVTADIPPGRTCAGRLCWTESAHRFKYVDPDALLDGIVRLTLTAGTEGHARIRLKAMGAHVHMPSLPLGQDPTVTVQIKNDRGFCWEANYTAPATTNSETTFRDNSD